MKKRSDVAGRTSLTTARNIGHAKCGSNAEEKRCNAELPSIIRGSVLIGEERANDNINRAATLHFTVCILTVEQLRLQLL